MGSDNRSGDRPGDREASLRQERKAAYVRLWKQDIPSEEVLRSHMLYAIWQTLEDINEALRREKPQMRTYSKRERERINQSVRTSGVPYHTGDALGGERRGYPWD